MNIKHTYNFLRIINKTIRRLIIQLNETKSFWYAIKLDKLVLL